MRSCSHHIFMILAIILILPAIAMGQNGNNPPGETAPVFADSILATMPDSVLALLPDSILVTLPDSVLALLPDSILVTLPDSVLALLPDSVLVTLPDSVLALLPDSVLVTLPDSVLVLLPDSILVTLPDSIQVRLHESAAADSLPVVPVPPGGINSSFTSTTKSSDISYKIDNQLKLSVAWPGSARLAGKIYFNRDLPREVKREKLDSGFNISTGLVAWDVVPLDLSASRSIKRSEQNKGESNYRRDDTENEGVNMAARSSKKLGSWFRINGRTDVNFSQVTTKNTLGLRRKTVDNRKNYGSSLDFTPASALKVVTGYSGSYTSGTGELVGYTDDVVSTRDSLQMRVNYKMGSVVTLSMTGGLLETSSERLDFLRDQYGLIVSVGGQDSIPTTEETTKNNWGTDFNADFKFGKWLEFKTTYAVKDEQKRVTNSITKDKDSDNTELKISSTIKPWSGQKVKLEYTQKTAHTVDANADKRKEAQKLLFEANQALSKTFKITLDAFFSLQQDFYADRVKNPQDMDKSQTRFTVHVIGQPLEWMTVDNGLLWHNKRDIQIDASRSISSKEMNTLTWKAKTNYSFWKKYKLVQFYEVSVMEDDFYFTKDKNSLDREYLLITESPQFPLWKFLSIGLKHEFRLREEGSYLPDPAADNVKTFFRDTRRKTEKIEINVSYAYRKYLNISVKEEVSREIEYSYLDESESSSFFGTLNFNLKFNQPLGEGGDVIFTLLHRARFGKFVRENQRRVWLPTLSISYTF